jgi:alpha-beta hydrolase superfamily lysophospholipase
MKYFSEKDGEVYAPCLRGFGYTTYKKEIKGVDDFANDLQDFMKECANCEKFYIAAHSIGGLIAMKLALNIGSNCLGMVLLNSVKPGGWGGSFN